MSKILGHKVQLALAVLKARREEIKTVQALVQKPENYDSMNSMEQTLWVIKQLGEVGSHSDARVAHLTEQINELNERINKK